MRYTVGIAPTKLVARPLVLRVKLGAPLVTLGQASATLTYGTAGKPAAGRSIVFASGGTPLCTARTAADGTAACAFSVAGLVTAALRSGYTATFNGDAGLQPAGATAPTAEILGLGVL